MTARKFYLNTFSTLILAVMNYVSEGKVCHYSVYSAPGGCMKWIVTKDLWECSKFSIGGYQASADLRNMAHSDDFLSPLNIGIRRSSEMTTDRHGEEHSDFETMTEDKELTSTYSTDTSLAYSSIVSTKATMKSDGNIDLCQADLESLFCTCDLLFPGDASRTCICSDTATGDSGDSKCLWHPTDCDEIIQNDVTEDGIYTINPSPGSGNSPFNVYCRMTDGGGWTVIQRRVEGEVDFRQGFNNYKMGFGNLDGDFWLGNEKLFRLTNQSTSRLRIDMRFDGGREVTVEYDAFRINDATDDFRLVSLGSFSSSFGGFDAMALCLNMGFTTTDHDVDTNKYNCASTSGGGWWYEGDSTGWCYHANLNGVYGDSREQASIIWYIGSGFDYEYLVKYVEMKIRPAGPKTDEDTENF